MRLLHCSPHLAASRPSSDSVPAVVGGYRVCSRQPVSHAPRSSLVCNATPELLDLAGSLAASMASHLPPLLYEPVALPCSMMKCGDVIYRSTLDPVLRGEAQGPDWKALALLAIAGGYLFLPPGVLPGIFDIYFLSNMYRRNSKVYAKDDIILGRQLATGGFGTVYRASIKEEDGSLTPVVVKKAKEFGEAEVWMNERMTRIGGGHCAEFVTAFDESSPSVGSPLDNAIWLVWKYEGDNTLYNIMEKKEFPYNLEPLLLKRELKLPRGARRKLVTIRLAMKQLMEALAACHSSGIVHRDTKPQNMIISTQDSKIKLIDLGAAADLRIGINYAPKEYLLDPRYAPPQQYVMSTQTPRPPPTPVAAFLSPVLWRMEIPDRFDMYSCGVTLLQMAFVNLRSDNSLIAFRRRLEDKYKWDLREWRRVEEKRGGKEIQDGFELLDLDSGAPWELLCSLMAYNPGDRPSAAEALRHPFFSSDSDSAVTSASSALLASAARGIGNALSSPRQMLDDAIMSGAKRGDLTENRLLEELGLEQEAPRATRMASNTIMWWQERQSDQKKRLGEKEKNGASSSASSNGNGVPPKVRAGAKPAARPAASPPKQADAANGNGNGNGVGIGPQAMLGLGAFLKLGGSHLGAKDKEQESDGEEEEEVEVSATEERKFSIFNMLSNRK